MASTGMRVFELTASKGATRPPLAAPLEDPLGTGRSAREHIEAAVAVLATPPDASAPDRRVTRTTAPNLRSMADWLPPTHPSKGAPQIWVSGARLVGSDQLLVTLKHGYYGEYDEAMGSDGSIDLSDHAPARTYRALFLFPSNGTDGRVVIDAIKRRCPITMLTHWISWATHAADSGNWLALKTVLLGDREHLKSFVRNSSKLTIELKETRPASPGRRRGTRTKLTMEVDSQLARAGVVDMLTEFIDGGEDAEYVERLEAYAGFDPSQLDDANLHFDDASVHVTGPDDETKRINLARLSDWFTYDVAVKAGCSDDDWVDAARLLLTGALSEGTDIQV